MRPIEYNASIGRSQDISPLKQAVDAKPDIDQQNIMQLQEKQIEEKSEQVYQKDDPAMNSQFDATKEGRNKYQQRKKKKQKEENEDGTVVLKKRATFDVKI